MARHDEHQGLDFSAPHEIIHDVFNAAIGQPTGFIAPSPMQ
jgi:hypothetical protein